jgi:FkbM family methyltransferase
VNLRTYAARKLPARLVHGYRMLRYVHLSPYEAELPMVRRWLDPAAVAIDVGANVGLYADVLAKGSARVIAFEPNRACADYLRRLRLARVEVVEAALSDSSGQAELRVPWVHGGEDHALGSIVAAGSAVQAGTVATYRVETLTLDEALATRIAGGERVAFVKIDVEGHELAVLSGAVDLLRRDRPALLVETEQRHGGAPGRVIAMMEALGYRAFVATGGTFTPVSAEWLAARQTPERAAAHLAGHRDAGYVHNVFFVADGRETQLRQ